MQKTNCNFCQTQEWTAEMSIISSNQAVRGWSGNPEIATAQAL